MHSISNSTLYLVTRDELSSIIQEAVSAAVAPRVPPVMNKKEIAAYLGKSVSWVDRWMKRGLPFEKYDEKSYPEFTKVEVDRWICEHFQKVPGQANRPERQELDQRDVVSLEKV